MDSSKPDQNKEIIGKIATGISVLTLVLYIFFTIFRNHFPETYHSIFSKTEYKGIVISKYTETEEVEGPEYSHKSYIVEHTFSVVRTPNGVIDTIYDEYKEFRIGDRGYLITDSLRKLDMYIMILLFAFLWLPWIAKFFREKSVIIKDMRKYGMNKEILAYVISLIYAIMLLKCLNRNTGYFYFQFIRIIGVVVFAILAYVAYKTDQKIFGIIFAISILAIQPFLKIPLGRFYWNIIDIVWFVVLIINANIIINNAKDWIKFYKEYGKYD